jgi:hypothetical protein
MERAGKQYLQVALLNLLRLNGQEVKPMIKKEGIMGERRVFTEAFSEAVLPKSLELPEIYRRGGSGR